MRKRVFAAVVAGLLVATLAFTVVETALAPVAVAQQQPPPIPTPPPPPPRPPTPTPNIPPTPVIKPNIPDVPPIPKGVGIDIPAVARQNISDKDFIELYSLISRWQVEQFFGVMDVMASSFAKLQPAAAAAGVQLDLPDIAAAKATVNAKLDAIGKATTLEQAQNAVNDLLATSRTVQDQFQGALGAKLESSIRDAATSLGDRVKDLVQKFADSETSRLDAEINAEVNSIVASVVASATAGGGQPNAAAITAQITAQVNAMVAQKTSSIEPRVRAYADSISATELKPLRDIETILTDMGNQTQRVIAQGTPQTAGLKSQALAKRKDITNRIIDANMAKARTQLQAARADLDAAKKQDPTAKSADEILAELDRDRAALNQKLDTIFSGTFLSADADVQFNAAIGEFATKWETLAKTAEDKKPTAASIRAMVRPQLVAARAQLQTGAQTIEQMLAQAAGKTDSQSQAINSMAASLRALIARINALNARIDTAIATLDGSAPADIKTWIDMLNSLQQDMQSLKADIDKAKTVESKTETILIQAEDEVSASVAKPGSNWDSVEEVRPSWRKGWIGSGDWYLSRGGDKLSYAFDVVSGGTFYMEVRDMNDGLHPFGSRTVTITIDGKVIGQFPEVSDTRGQFLWHILTDPANSNRPLTINLTPGRHSLEVTKTQTTSAAAHLDAFYFTTDTKIAPPESAPTPELPKLGTVLTQAKTAIENFNDLWRNIPQTGPYVQTNIVTKVRPQLVTTRDQLVTSAQTIGQLLSSAAGKSDPESLSVNLVSADLRVLIDRINANVTRIDGAISIISGPVPADPKPWVDILDALQVDLFHRLRGDIDNILYKYKVKTESILIQAENEIKAEVQKPGTSWDSAEEVKPSWRSGWTGTGDWYLSRGGDNLTYTFNTVSSSADFFIWIRDWDDGKHPPGAGTITVTIDGAKAGDFPENSVRNSQHQWHQVGKVTLRGGSHTMVVTKTATTSKAAILDAFFFSNDAAVKP